jgi:hypothetical protein
MKSSPLNVSVSNNRTPIELVLPFSGDLTIEQLLDVVRSVLGVTTKRVNFPDLDTSCGASLSLTVDRVPQSFKKKLSELTEEQRAKLQFWIKFIWQDGLQDDENSYDGTRAFFMGRTPALTGNRPASERERGKMTLDRMESLIQSTIWRSLPAKT